MWVCVCVNVVWGLRRFLRYRFGCEKKMILLYVCVSSSPQTGQQGQARALSQQQTHVPAQKLAWRKFQDAHVRQHQVQLKWVGCFTYEPACFGGNTTKYKQLYYTPRLCHNHGRVSILTLTRGLVTLTPTLTVPKKVALKKRCARFDLPRK